MIYALGDSFTKWYWPTWADWLAQYTNQSVTNLAYTGFTNQLTYYRLLDLRPQLSTSDTVYIMWTGSNRVCAWYDQEYIDQQDCQGFFPPTDGQLWFTQNTPWTGFYKLHPDHLPSMTQMIIDNFDTMLKTQWLLNSVGCDYRMMFWQNPWLDTRETFSPTYHSSWDQKQIITDEELQRATIILEMPLVKNMLGLIDWKKFVNSPTDIFDPATYQGLWEFTLNSRELVLLNHCSDPHPNTLAHHDWVTEFLLSGVVPTHRTQALKCAQQCQNMSIPDYDFVKCISGHVA